MRKRLRFNPDPNTLASIRFGDDDERTGTKFVQDLVALVLDESLHGACLISAHANVDQDQLVMIQVGEIGPLKAQIRWVKHIEKNLIKFGVEFLE